MAGKQDDEAPEHVSGQSNVPMTAPAHALTIDQVVEQLRADIDVGLSAEEAKQRLEANGRNEFGEQKGVQPIKIFIGQIANALTLVSTRILSDWGRRLATVEARVPLRAFIRLLIAHHRF